MLITPYKTAHTVHVHPSGELPVGICESFTLCQQRTYTVCSCAEHVQWARVWPMYSIDIRTY